MQNDCTKSWQVGQTVLSAYLSDTVSLSLEPLLLLRMKNIPLTPGPKPHKPPFEGSMLKSILSLGILHF